MPTPLVPVLLILMNSGVTPWTTTLVPTLARASSLKGREMEEDLDPIEKLFNFFWGEKEDEPAGLKRFGREKFPEQYPCTKTKWADILPRDKGNGFERFRPMLACTNMERREMRLAYDAQRDGWSASTFHFKVDRRGAALVVLELKDGQILGGYNPKGWVGYGEYRSSIAAFLFSFEPGRDRPTKLQKVGGKGLSVVDNPEDGPKFGMDSLIVKLESRTVNSKLGNYYERMPESDRNSLIATGRMSAPLKNVKIFTGYYEEGEEIPFSDAEPFALY